jgi:hypothetical protein
MDIYKQFDALSHKRTVRDSQDVERITRKDETRIFPYKNTCKKGQGEYFSTLEDRIKVRLSNHNYSCLNI